MEVERWHGRPAGGVTQVTGDKNRRLSQRPGRKYHLQTLPAFPYIPLRPAGAKRLWRLG